MALLLKAQRIIDGEGGVLEEHGVLVDDGLITRIAPQAEFEGFTGETVTVAGGSLLPGLIDCHVHLCFGAEPNPGETVERMRPGEIAMRALENAQATLRGGITAVRDCGGKDYLEHGFFMTEHCVAEMVDRGTFLVPTLSALGNILGPFKDRVPDYVVDKAQRTTEAHRRSVMLFRDAGGRIAMGTDAGTPFNRHGENAQELRYMVETGLSAMEAIIASTSNAADLMHLANTGRIREGAVADLLMVSGNPLADIRHVSERGAHQCIVKAGVVVHHRPSAGESARQLAAE